MKWFRPYAELFFWVGGLLLLAFMNPDSNTYYSLCFFRFLGISWCPGCGLGHSISFLFHGNLGAAFSAHPLGPFALLVIVYRIYTLLSIHFFSPHQINPYGPQLPLDQPYHPEVPV